MISPGPDHASVMFEIHPLERMSRHAESAQAQAAVPMMY